MICPVCKYAMIVVEYRSIELDYCNSCKGVWFDSGELELLLKSQDFEDPNAFLDGIINSPEAISPEKKRNCPLCGHKMKKTAISEQPKTLIDMCRNGHGLWFDGGEVAQLIRRLAGEHPPKHDSREQITSFLEEVFKAPELGGNDD
ncbi:MAG: zf-TFIIB domain-containing protein [Chloroflexota bacterium]